MSLTDEQTQLHKFLAAGLSALGYDDWYIGLKPDEITGETISFTAQEFTDEHLALEAPGPKIERGQRWREPVTGKVRVVRGVSADHVTFDTGTCSPVHTVSMSTFRGFDHHLETLPERPKDVRIEFAEDEVTQVVFDYEPADSCYVPEDEFHDAIGQPPLEALRAELKRLKTAKADAIAVLEGLLEANRNRVDELTVLLSQAGVHLQGSLDANDALKAKLRRSKAKRAKLKRQRDEARAEQSEIVGDCMAREKGIVARAEARVATQIAAWLMEIGQAYSAARVRDWIKAPKPEAPEAPAGAAEGERPQAHKCCTLAFAHHGECLPADAEPF